MADETKFQLIAKGDNCVVLESVKEYDRCVGVREDGTIKPALHCLPADEHAQFCVYVLVRFIIFFQKKNVTLHCTCISFEWKLFYVVFFCRKLHWLKRQLQLKGNNSFFLSLSFTLTCILIFIDCDRIKINHFKCGLCTVYLQLFFFYFFFLDWMTFYFCNNLCLYCIIKLFLFLLYESFK